MRSLEVIPAGLAVAGLVIPLVASDLVVWPLTLLWIGVLVSFVVARRGLKPGRAARIVGMVVCLPTLVLAGWEGGWWMVPAAVAQLVIDAVKRDE